MNDLRRAHLRPHDPFDDSAAERHRRMGLLRADGQADGAAVSVLSHLYAGLFYDALCDFSGSMEAAHVICTRLLELAAEAEPRRVLLAISMQYDAMYRTLPEPIWWIAGSNTLLPPFIAGFTRHLAELTREEVN